MVIRPEKVAMIATMKETMKNAKGAVLTDYRGIKVAQDTKLRRKMREAGVQYSVIKNNMASIAAKEAGIEGLDDYLKGLSNVPAGGGSDSGSGDNSGGGGLDENPLG